VAIVPGPISFKVYNEGFAENILAAHLWPGNESRIVLRIDTNVYLSEAIFWKTQ
jgi:hypothetical protein